MPKAVGAAVIVGAAIVPAVAVQAAQAATLSVNAACYVVAPRARPTVTIAGAGYTPGDSIAVYDSQGGIDTTTTVNAAGQIGLSVPAPVPELEHPGIVKDTITADDEPLGGAEIKATAVADLTRFDFGDSGTRKAPGLRAFTEKTTWRFSGLPEGHTIYGHYTNDGKLTARQAFGRAQGPCGTLTTRKRLYPATPHHKAYTIQVDTKKRYSRKTVPSGRLKLSLTFF